MLQHDLHGMPDLRVQRAVLSQQFVLVDDLVLVRHTGAVFVLYYVRVRDDRPVGGV